MKFWPTQTYVLKTKRSKDEILRALSLYTAPEEPSIKYRGTLINKKFIGSFFADGFEMTPVRYSGFCRPRSMVYFFGKVSENIGHTEIFIRTKYNPVSAIWFITFISILAAIFIFLLFTCEPKNLGFFMPLIIIFWIYIIIIIDLKLSLSSFKKRLRQVIIDF